MTQFAAATAEPSREPAVQPEELDRAIEAVLLSSDRPVTAERFVSGLRLVPGLAPDAGAAEGLILAGVERLNEAYATTGRSFRIERVAGGYRAMTLSSLGPAVWAFHQSRSASRLSRAAIETLAVVAYRQPITRAELESIRGVACGEVLRSLLDRRLITIQGRAEELGRPILYATTKEFLDAFGLASIKDLPAPGELAPPSSPTPPADDTAATPEVKP